ncbi:Flp family type IVb pilin [Rhizobium sp. 9T]|uniref:Flp family type IVb pilin n=1 Tax=Rhizobium croatiense TaxID=2867516 RepID=A0ABS7M5H7_9HYPH|nr:MULTISPECIES: Flp family type IVb pilin [Rhizobium]MBY4611829.1 Flp family type IVb pilin [Rhizobium croatiense]MBY4632344.1 Flp family type IVb pilin [Rhizobium croatiense]PDT07153.1 Flp family type IVb pilin [Rhizobium sp. M1]PDT31878.1 Flp family type IVb pilin [Rhizobium sp. M10]
MRLLKAFLADGTGATAVEYGLIAAVICTALVSGLGIFSGSLQNVFSVVSNNITVN